MFVGCRLWPFRIASLGCLGLPGLACDVLCVKWPCVVAENSKNNTNSCSNLARMLIECCRNMTKYSNYTKFHPFLMCKLRFIAALQCFATWISVEDFPWEPCAMPDSHLRRRAGQLEGGKTWRKHQSCWNDHICVCNMLQHVFIYIYTIYIYIMYTINIPNQYIYIYI